MNKPRRQTWPQLYPVSVSFKHLHWRIISYFPPDEMLHVVHHRVNCSSIILLYCPPLNSLAKRHKEGLGLLSLDAMWWHGKNSRPTHRSEVWGVNNSDTTPPCVVSSTQTSKWTNHWQLTILYFFLFKTEIDEKKKKTGYCTCTSTKIVFRVFFHLNIEEGNNSTYQELLAYHFVLVAAIATELRRRWHFDSLSMISASPAGAITRNSFNPYLKGNHNFRWSLRTLT